MRVIDLIYVGTGTKIMRLMVTFLLFSCLFHLLQSLFALVIVTLVVDVNLENVSHSTWTLRSLEAADLDETKDARGRGEGGLKGWAVRFATWRGTTAASR